MRISWLETACVLMLAAIWALDLASPQLFVVAILLTAPIALSGLTLRPRFTLALIVLALAADGSAAWSNALHDNRWQALAIGDRLLAAFAILLVGLLTDRVQRVAIRAAELGEASSRSEAIRDVIYAVSHDLRTPIMAARMTMQQALAGEYGALPERYREILKRSIASNDDLHRLAETLLLVARDEDGALGSARDDVDLCAIAHAVITELQDLAQVGGVALVSDLSERALVVAGDAAQLKRAITNLVANAIAWTPSGGRVRLSLTADDRACRLSVEDNGYGVPPAGRSALFKRFARLARSTGGSGLGLYIVSRIAEAHGGNVRYTPLEPRGSSFAMTLPLYDRVQTL